jgi:ParB family chromosome partitioning protein
MSIITISPINCTRWQYADRSFFEFGDISVLAEDIKRNGQIEPVIIRPNRLEKGKYEIIAGSRRWKACIDAGLMLKAMVLELNDEEAAIIQIKENQSLSICDYSKGMYYAKLLTDKKITQEKLAQNINCSRQKLQNFLSFSKVPQEIWDAVGNMSKISSRTAATVLSIAQQGTKHVDILIDLADEIRKGAGGTRLQRMVDEIVLGNTEKNIEKGAILSPSGAVIGVWKNNSLKLSKDLNIDQIKFLKYITNFFKTPHKDNI